MSHLCHVSFSPHHELGGCMVHVSFICHISFLTFIIVDNTMNGYLRSVLQGSTPSGSIRSGDEVCYITTAMSMFILVVFHAQRVAYRLCVILPFLYHMLSYVTISLMQALLV